MHTGDEFLSRFGDIIDDRVAEMLDEILDDRHTSLPSRRLPSALAVLTLILALPTGSPAASASTARI